MITVPFDLLPHTHTGKLGGHVHGFSFFEIGFYYSVLKRVECDYTYPAARIK